MKTAKVVMVLAAALALGCLHPRASRAALIDLQEVTFNIDGAVWDWQFPDPVPPLPAGVTGFDFSTQGTGTVTINLTGGGTHTVGAFFDVELDQNGTGWSNETGTQNGAVPGGLSWEVDDPYGAIYSDFTSGVLTNVPSGYYGDVSVALLWSGVADGSTVWFNISDFAPSGGFYLEQTDDANAGAKAYFTTGVRGGGPNPVPEPGTMVLLGTGLVGLGCAGWKRRK